MLAARDQENLVHGYQQAAASKSLNQGARGAPPKTPGTRYPKTPLKIPIYDENAPAGFGHIKSVLGTRARAFEGLTTSGKLDTYLGKDDFVTPMGPRNRAPLGIKTTNAKTKAFQTPAGHVSNIDVEKAQAKPTSAHRQNPKVLHTETVKVNVLNEETSTLNERDVEYCPPKPKDLPYESEDFPDGRLNYDMLKGPNLMRGWQSYYYDPVDESGVSRKEKEFDKAATNALNEADEKIRKAVEDVQWTVGDVPETFGNQFKDMNDTATTNGQTKKASKLPSRGPATVTSRKAVAALSAIPKAPLGVPNCVKIESKPTTSFLARGMKAAIPTPINLSEMRYTTATVVSRSTIGYTKGRSTSHVLNMGYGVQSRPTITGLGAAIPPSRFAKIQPSEGGREEWRRLDFLGVFDSDDEDIEPGLRGGLPDCLRKDDDYEEEFVLTLGVA